MDKLNKQIMKGCIIQTQGPGDGDGDTMKDGTRERSDTVTGSNLGKYQTLRFVISCSPLIVGIPKNI